MLKLLKFEAEWCGPCKLMKPIWEKIKNEFTDIEFVSVDIDNDSQLAAKFSISSIPTIIVVKDGKEVKRFVGLISENNIKDYLTKE